MAHSSSPYSRLPLFGCRRMERIFLFIIPLIIFLSACSPSEPTKEEKELLRLVDGDTRSALGLADSLISVSAGDSTMLARVAALRSFARYRSYYNDTADEYLDSAALARLRMMGPDGLPYLIRGLFSEGNIAFRKRRYQDALNLMGECAYRSLYQAHDTFIAARAYEELGRIYSGGSQIIKANENRERAIILYKALRDTFNADYTRLSIAYNFSLSYDPDLVDSAFFIVDSIWNANKSNERYIRFLSLRYRSCYALLKTGRYHSTINNAKLLLAERGKTIDSVAAYYTLLMSSIRLGKYADAKLYLDTLKKIDMAYEKYDRGSMALSTTGGELELFDSLYGRNNQQRVTDIIKRYRAQNDSLIAKQRIFPGDVIPQFDADFPKDDGHTYLWILLAATLILAIIIAIYRHNNKDLKVQLDNLNHSLLKLQANLSETLNKSVQLEEDLKQRISENDNLENNVCQLNELVRKRDVTILEIQNMLSRSLLENKIHGLSDSERNTVIDSIIYKNKLISRLYRILSDVTPKSSPIEIKAIADKTENLFSNISFEEIRREIEAELRFRYDDWDFIYKKAIDSMSESNVQILMLLLYLPDIGIITRLTGLKRSTIYNRREIIVSELGTITSPSINVIINLINRRSK